MSSSIQKSCQRHLERTGQHIDRRHGQTRQTDGDVNVKLQGACAIILLGHGQCGHETFVMDWITGCLKEVKKKHPVDWKPQNRKPNKCESKQNSEP